MRRGNVNYWLAYFRIQTYRILVISSLIAIYPIQVLAQESELLAMDRMISVLDSVNNTAIAYLAQEKELENEDNLVAVYNYNFDSSWYPKGSTLAVDQWYLSKNYGFSIETGYLENFNQNVFGNEAIYYNRRFRAGIRWDIMKSGLLENSAEARILERKQQIQLIENKDVFYKSRSQDIENTINLIFDGQLERHLDKYGQVLGIHQNKLRDLYEMGYKSWDEVLQAVSLWLDVSLRKRATSSSLQMLVDQLEKDFLAKDLPVVNVKLEPLEDELYRNPSQALINELQLKNVREKNKSWKDVSLAANLNYNYYSSSSSEQIINTDGTRDYISLGINMSLPFSVFRNKAKVYEKAYRTEIAHDSEVGFRNESYLLHKYYAEYQKMLLEYTRHYNTWRHILHWISEIQDPGPNSDLWESPANLFQKVLVLMDKKELLIEKKRALCLKLLQIQKMVPELSILAFTEDWQMPGLIEREEHQQILFGQKNKSGEEER